MASSGSSRATDPSADTRRSALRASQALLLSAFLGLAQPLAAQTQQVDDTTKATARDLAQRGAAAYDAGDYRTAQDLFHRAYALVPAPTLSLREARALAKLGRLVEAFEMYVRTARTKLAPDAPDVFRRAVEDANDELVKLRQRVPRLKIVVQGVDSSSGDVQITLDGKPLRPELIGVESLTDPGTHQVEAVTSNGQHDSATVKLAEGESRSVALKLEAPSLGTNQSVPAKSPNADTTEEHPSSSRRTFAIIAFGVGAAGIGTGVVTGILATKRHSSAEETCPNKACAPGTAGADDVEAFRTLRTVSTVSYAVGAVGVAAGAVLLFTAPERRGTRSVSPYVGFATAGLRGRF